MFTGKNDLAGGGLPVCCGQMACGRMVGVLLFAALLLGGPTTPAVGQEFSQGKGNLRVMTYNVDEGADLSIAFTATTFAEFLADITTILNNVRATNPPERAAAIARQIGEAKPTLVSLQEATEWQTCPATADFKNCAGPPTVQFDLLQLILDALQQQGQSYKVVTTEIANNLAAPSSAGVIVFYTQRIAILARADIDPNQLRLSNIQADTFAATFTVPIVTGSVVVHRAWAAVDVKLHHTDFRYIATQLEAFDPNVNYAQGQELLTGPANTSLPIIMAMDSNSKANAPPNAFTPTYDSLISGGFTDAWTAANPDDPGPTCCQAETLLNPISLVTDRIDLVLVRGGLEVRAARIFGGSQRDRTPSGLWPSDHAAVAARLKFGEDED
jgi:hypothetical protein